MCSRLYNSFEISVCSNFEKHNWYAGYLCVGYLCVGYLCVGYLYVGYLCVGTVFKIKFEALNNIQDGWVWVIFSQLVKQSPILPTGGR